jgi:hypothetical protein
MGTQYERNGRQNGQGADAKDALLGRVFAHAAVARSGRLGGAAPGAAAPAAARVAGARVDAMHRKAFLREARRPTPTCPRHTWMPGRPWLLCTVAHVCGARVLTGDAAWHAFVSALAPAASTSLTPLPGSRAACQTVPTVRTNWCTAVLRHGSAAARRGGRLPHHSMHERPKTLTQPARMRHTLGALRLDMRARAQAAAEALLDLAEALDARALARLLGDVPALRALLTAPPADALPEARPLGAGRACM